MQTFLPYPDFQDSAMALDRQRLGKQRVEGVQMLQTLLAGNGAWLHHPATQMWKGYEGQLALYTIMMVTHWVSRGYKDTRMQILRRIITDNKLNYKKPWWLGNESFHASHRAALLFKNPNFYEKYDWSETPEINYWWPTKNDGERITRSIIQG